VATLIEKECIICNDTFEGREVTQRCPRCYEARAQQWTKPCSNCDNRFKVNTWTAKRTWVCPACDALGYPHIRKKSAKKLLATERAYVRRKIKERKDAEKAQRKADKERLAELKRLKEEPDPLDDDAGPTQNKHHEKYLERREEELVELKREVKRALKGWKKADANMMKQPSKKQVFWSALCDADGAAYLLTNAYETKLKMKDREGLYAAYLSMRRKGYLPHVLVYLDAGWLLRNRPDLTTLPEVTAKHPLKPSAPADPQRRAREALQIGPNPNEHEYQQGAA